MPLSELIQAWHDSKELAPLYIEFSAYALALTVPSEVSSTLKLSSEQVRSAFLDLFLASTFRLMGPDEERYPTSTEAIERFRSRIGTQNLLEILLVNVQSQGVPEHEVASQLERIAANELWRRGGDEQ